jgi:uncharacterized protein YlxW (UPF0749 family)
MMLLAFMLGLAAAEELNPITRVAQLLEGLAKKIDSDEDAEQELYDSYKCWCKTVVTDKLASIDNNKQKIAELQQYIDDLDSGRIELTSERTDLEKEIKDLQASIKEEEDMRAKEYDDYVAAKDEMTKAIAALEKAVDTMAKGTEGSFLHMTRGLKKAMKVGKGFLAKKDIAALFQAAQPEDVPDADWEKLNREATFKQKYTKRSGEIQEILAEMLQTFKDNLAEAEAAETKAADDSKTLLKGKNDALDDKQNALRDQAGENGARGESKADSEEQVRDMSDQNTRDEGYIADTQASCATKADEWGERKRLRKEEKASIAQAIATLRSDDARDLFKKSFDSHGALFVQTSALVRKVEHQHPTLMNGLAQMKRAAVKSGDMRLLLLAQSHAGKMGGDPFGPVIKDIDGFLADLKKEEEADMAEKAMCEKERSERTQKVQIFSKQIDMSTTVIGRLTEHIAENQKQVDSINVEIKENEDAKKEATEIRNNEKAEHASSEADDTAAGKVVENAIEVLKSFYKNNELSGPGFIQVRAKKDEEPGEAPTPPPSTWGDTYKGASGESGGIVALMEGIKADIDKDIRAADKEESDAQAAYDKLCADIDRTIAMLKSCKSDLEAMIASDQGSITQQKESRSTDQASLQSHLDFLKEIATACDFMAANFESRMANRAEEVDGLNQAKATFSGATFN